jgi:hypothetical protein
MEVTLSGEVLLEYGLLQRGYGCRYSPEGDVAVGQADGVRVYARGVPFANAPPLCVYCFGGGFEASMFDICDDIVVQGHNHGLVLFCRSTGELKRVVDCVWNSLKQICIMPGLAHVAYMCAEVAGEVTVLSYEDATYRNVVALPREAPYTKVLVGKRLLTVTEKGQFVTYNKQMIGCVVHGANPRAQAWDVPHSAHPEDMVWRFGKLWVLHGHCSVTVYG